MKVLSGDNFCEVSKYRLYRTVYEIVHPTISKKNISNYRVVFDDKLLPVLVYYPQKISNINSVIIYVPGDGLISGSYGKYEKICKKMAIETNSLVIAIDYFNSTIKYPTVVNKIFKLIKFLYDQFEKIGICNEKITLMGDSTGCIILSNLVSKMISKNLLANKMIMFYPVVRYDYSDYCWNETYLNININLDKKINNYLKRYFSKSKEQGCSLLERDNLLGFPKTLILTAEMDILKEDGNILSSKFISDVEGSKYCNIKFANHGFLSCADEEMQREMYNELNNFLIQ